MSNNESAPVIRSSFISQDQRNYFNLWGISYEAQIVPPFVTGQREVALWYGTQDIEQVVPVLAVPISVRQVNPNKLIGWFCGVASKVEIGAAEDPFVTYLDSAYHSANNLFHAIEMLNKLAPIKQAV